MEKVMAETVDKIIDAQINQAAFEKNISDISKYVIANTDPDTYKTASMRFVSMANGDISQDDFKKEYSKLDIPVSMLKTVIQQTHLSGGIGTGGRIISGQEATEYTRQSVIENLAEDIAEAKYPIIDRKKSTDISNAFAEAKTPEQRAKAIEKYGQLEQAFQFSDVMMKIQEITKIKENITHEYITQKIATGEIPQITEELKAMVIQQEQIDKSRLHPQNELGH